MPRCRTCQRKSLGFDKHSLCPQHRECSQIAPCATCAVWPESHWAQIEAWLLSHIPPLRAPALVPTASAPVDEGQSLSGSVPNLSQNASLPPASPRDVDPALPGLEIFASEDSDLDESERRDWQRSTSPSNQVGSRISTVGGLTPQHGLSYGTTAGVSVPNTASQIRASAAGGQHATSQTADKRGPQACGLMPPHGETSDRVSAAAGPRSQSQHATSQPANSPTVATGVSFLTRDHQGAVNRFPCAGWIPPPHGEAPGRVHAAGPRFQSQQAASHPATSRPPVRGWSPAQWEGLAEDRSHAGGTFYSQPLAHRAPGSLGPTPTAGGSIAPQGDGTNLVFSTVPGLTAQLEAPPYPRAPKRPAATPAQSDPPKRKKGGKKNKTGSKNKATTKTSGAKKKKKSSKTRSIPAAPRGESDVYSMLQHVASEHGWSITADPSGAAAADCLAVGQSQPPNIVPVLAPIPAPVPTAHAGTDRSPFNWERTSRRPPAPAALGAPPGEETYGMSADTAPPPTAHTLPAPTEITTDDTSNSATPWSITDSDIDRASMISSTVTSTLDTEVHHNLGHISEEAEALLLRYLPEFYSVDTDDQASEPQSSLLFRGRSEPEGGIPLTTDFRGEYERLGKETRARKRTPSLQKAFRFQRADYTKYFATEQISPELKAFGDYISKSNPLKGKHFQDEDRRWAHVGTLARSCMRLAAYAGALANLSAQAETLRVSDVDRTLLSSLMLSITELQWAQSTRLALHATQHRRTRTIKALGFSDQATAQLIRDIPFEGPNLFAGKITDTLGQEIDTRNRAAELAKQLRQSRPLPRTLTRPKPPARAGSRNVTVTVPPPQPQPGYSAPQPQPRYVSQRSPRGRGYSGKRRPARGRRGF